MLNHDRMKNEELFTHILEPEVWSVIMKQVRLFKQKTKFLGDAIVLNAKDDKGMKIWVTTLDNENVMMTVNEGDTIRIEDYAGKTAVVMEQLTLERERNLELMQMNDVLRERINELESQNKDKDKNEDEDEGKSEGSSTVTTQNPSNLVFEILIKPVTGTPFALLVEPRDTINKVKGMIQDKTGTPKNQQRLSYAGKELQKGKLADHAVGEGSELRLTQ